MVPAITWAFVLLVVAGCHQTPPANEVAVVADSQAPAPTADAELTRLEQQLNAMPDDHELADEYRRAARAAGAEERSALYFERLVTSPHGQLAPVHYQLGMALVDLIGRVPAMGKAALASRAVVAFNHAIAREPAMWDAHYARALVLLRTPSEYSSTAQAVAAFKELAVRQDRWPERPSFALAYVGLGDALVRAGDTAGAAAAWRAGYRKFPHDEILAHRLGERPAVPVAPEK